MNLGGGNDGEEDPHYSPERGDEYHYLPPHIRQQLRLGERQLHPQEHILFRQELDNADERIRQSSQYITSQQGHALHNMQSSIDYYRQRQMDIEHEMQIRRQLLFEQQQQQDMLARMDRQRNPHERTKVPSLRHHQLQLEAAAVHQQLQLYRSLPPPERISLMQRQSFLEGHQERLRTEMNVDSEAGVPAKGESKAAVASHLQAEKTADAQALATGNTIERNIPHAPLPGGKLKQSDTEKTNVDLMIKSTNKSSRGMANRKDCSPSETLFSEGKNSITKVSSFGNVAENETLGLVESKNLPGKSTLQSDDREGDFITISNTVASGNGLFVTDADTEAAAILVETPARVKMLEGVNCARAPESRTSDHAVQQAQQSSTKKAGEALAKCQKSPGIKSESGTTEFFQTNSSKSDESGSVNDSSRLNLNVKNAALPALEKNANDLKPTGTTTSLDEKCGASLSEKNSRLEVLLRASDADQRIKLLEKKEEGLKIARDLEAGIFAQPLEVVGGGRVNSDSTASSRTGIDTLIATLQDSHPLSSSKLKVSNSVSKEEFVALADRSAGSIYAGSEEVEISDHSESERESRLSHDATLSADNDDEITSPTLQTNVIRAKDVSDADKHKGSRLQKLQSIESDEGDDSPEENISDLEAVSDNTWWPTDHNTRREKNCDAASSPNETLAAHTDQSTIASQIAKLDPQEPGALEKLPPCRLHLRKQRKEGVSPVRALFCVQVTEVYPTEVMVCCSVCSTWRHAACGGHHSFANSQGSINPRSVFTPLCDKCFEENKILQSEPALKQALEKQRWDHLRKTLAADCVIRHAAFSLHNGTEEWPLGSVPKADIDAHIDRVTVRHNEAGKQWKSMMAKLNNAEGLSEEDFCSSRAKVFEWLRERIEEAEMCMNRHNMILFLQQDTSRAQPVGYENERGNIFDPADDDIKLDLKCNVFECEKAKNCDEPESSIALSSGAENEESAEDCSQSSQHSLASEQSEGGYGKKSTRRQESATASVDMPLKCYNVKELRKKRKSSGTAQRISVEVDDSEMGSEPGGENGILNSSVLHCARPTCRKKPRFDSIFCSDGCGVAACELDLLKTLEYSFEIHPSALR